MNTRGRSEPAKVVRVGLDVRQVGRNIDLPEEWRRGAEQAAEAWNAGDSRYWVATRSPHEVLRFEGSLGAAGSAQASIERVR